MHVFFFWFWLVFYPFWYCLLRLGLAYKITNRGLVGISCQWIDYQCTIMAWAKFLPIMIDTNWWKQILNFTIAKHGQSIGNKNNALLTIGKSLVEQNTWKSWPAKCLNALVKDQQWLATNILPFITNTQLH